MASKFASKRSQPAGAALGQKRAKLSQELSELARKEANLHANQELSEVIANLIENPHLVPFVKAALAARLAEPALETMFPGTYIYLHKVPKAHLMKSTLPGLSPSLDPTSLGLLAKKDRNVLAKLLYFLTMTAPSPTLTAKRWGCR